MPITQSIDLLFKALGTIAIVIAIYQLQEARKKRLIDMYWKIADIYYSEEQREARSNIWLLQTTYLLEKSSVQLTTDELINAYNIDYHNTNIEANKKIDKSVINRIRF